MIKLTVNAQYDERVILKNAKMYIPKGNVTILCGPSGSGKSTLLKAITFQNDFANEYYVDGIAIHTYKKEEQLDVVCRKYGVIYQHPQLLEELTIADHIHMIKSFSDYNKDEKKLIEELDLQASLLKFPNQLSGGEQIRVALLLSILKNPEYLILDEPTSSLDEYHTDMVMRIARVCAQANMGVLISTHDEKLIKSGDHVYEISNKQLQEKKKDTMLEQNDLTSDFHCKKCVHCFTDVFRKIRKNQKCYQKILFYISIICISLVSFSFSFNNLVNSIQQKQLSEFASDEVIVYKDTMAKRGEESYSFSESTEPIREDELAKIQELSGIKSLEWRYDMPCNDELTFALTDERYYHPELYHPEFKIRNKESIEKVLPYQGLDILLCTYLKQDLLKKDIAFHFQEEGVYISRQLAEKLSINTKELKGKELTFTILIPIYSTYGKSWNYEYGDGNVNYIDMPTCKDIEVTLPIAGILKESNLGIRNNYENVIYIHRDFIETKIKEYTENNTDVIYMFDEATEDFTINTFPSHRKNEIRRIIRNHPWAAKAYTLKAERIDDVPRISEELRKLGFQVDSQYLDYKTISDATINTQKILQYCSIAITMIVILVYLAMKFNEREKERQINQFLYELGLSKKEVLHIKCKKYFQQSILVMVIVILLVMVWILVFNAMRLGMTAFHIKLFIIACGLSLFIEFVIPMWIERGITHAYIK